MTKKLEHPVAYKTIINFETGESEYVPEGREERRARLARERAARKAAAFSNRALDDARTEALTEAWRRVYDGAVMPIHYDLVLSSKGFTKTERYTLVDAAFIENIFDPSQLVGCKGAVTLKRSRPKTTPADFVHQVKLG